VSAERRRQRLLAVGLHAVAVAALVPTFLFVAPPSRLDHALLLGVLLAVAALAGLSDELLGNRLSFDATLPLALMALVLGGPLPAYALLLVPLVLNAALKRHSLLSAGALADVAALGWETIAGAGVLALAGVSGLSANAMPTLFTVGFVLWCVNFALGPAIFMTLYRGQPVARLREQFKELTPAVLGMNALAVVTAALVPVLGVGALAGFAVIVLVPGSVLTLAARHRPANEMDVVAATRVYADAIADVLQLDRAERSLIARAAERLNRPTWDRLALRRSAGAPSPDHEVGYIAFHAGEHWDGSGEPAGLRGTLTPRPSRVLAVAQAWSALTAQGTAELSHEEAMLALAARSGTRYDPDIVAAASTVVEQERGFATHPSFAPRAHTWPGSYSLRREVARRLSAAH
jgi:HD domain-containing protein